MSKYMTHSKATQMSTMQQGHKASHPGPGAAAMPKHKDIAQRAYAIYFEKDCRQGQSEQNWLQAEQELKSQENWLEAGRDMKDQDPAEDLAAH
jgi:hypothetical protein